MRIRTSGFPNLGKRNYAAIREHYDSVKPWDSKYNPDFERPIGQRACKLNDRNHHHATRFNKAMRMLRDGSIAFRLYDTDCVVYHPDDSLTVHGYASVSTNDFIRALVPEGISHSCRHEWYNGRRGAAFDPILQLSPLTEHWYSSDYRYPDVRDRKVIGPDWRSGMIINCDGPVRLNYNVKRAAWLPVDMDDLPPFSVPTIDRKRSREVSREYHLPLLDKVLNAAVALVGGPGYISQRTAGGVPMADIMDCLKDEKFAEAIALMPRGGGSRAFGRKSAPSHALQPGFLRRLRDHIYDHEGVIVRVDKPWLSPSAYRKYVADSNRF